MPITTSRHVIIGGAPPVKVYTAPAGIGQICIIADGSSVYIGGNNALSLSNGFKMGATTITLNASDGDEIWALSTSDTILSIIAQVEA